LNATNGIFLDRGYTGHEHLLGVGLINMNARLYDPKLRRFLQTDNEVQDPSKAQDYNRYGYCLNNPLKFNDPSGNHPILIGIAIAAIMHVGVSLVFNNHLNAMGIIQAGLAGALTGGPTNGIGNYMATIISAQIGKMLPSLDIPINDHFRINVSLSIALGNAEGIGMNISTTYNDGNFYLSAGFGVMKNSNYNGFGKNGEESRISFLAGWDDGKTGVSLGSNIWGGDFAQRTGTLGIRSGNFRAFYENDGKPFNAIKTGDGGDSYRTAALNLSWQDYSFGFNLFTGLRTNSSYKNEKSGNWDGIEGEVGSYRNGNFGEHYINGLVDERGPKYRMGAAYFNYQGYSFGSNSEWVRHAIQNVAIHGTFIANQRMFEMQNSNNNFYNQYRTTNNFTTW
jgi:RHS repeat-associated protein